MHPELKILFTVSITATLLGLGQRAMSFGIVDYNDECEYEVTDYSTFQSRYDESKFCDSTRGLYCVPGLGRCGCFIPHTIYRAGKCRAKIGNSCLAPGNARVDCVEHARCTNNNTASTFQCHCIRGYLSNAMKTACFPVGYADRRRGFGKAYDYGYGYNNDNYYWRGAATELQPSKIFYLIYGGAVVLWSIIRSALS